MPGFKSLRVPHEEIDLILQMVVKILKQKTIAQCRDYAVLTKIVIVDMRV